MKPLYKYLILFVIFAGCKRENVDVLGPSYVMAPEGFSITGFKASKDSINFDSSSVMFNATFSHPVSWTLTVKGQNSGAIKEYKGISNSLNNIEWTGAHDGIFFFRSGEKSTATVSFFGTSLTSYLNLNVVKVPDFKTCTRFFPDEGDFEKPANVLKYDKWHAFNNPTPIPNVEQGVDSMQLDYQGNVVSAPQGKCYYYIKGKGNQANFVSGIQYDTKPAIAVVAQIPANPDSVWFNVYMYGTGDANMQVEIELQESDADGDKSGYQGADDDAWVARVVLDHKGWKLFSFKYSDLVRSANASFGGSGNNIKEPNRLMSFDFILIKKSNPNSAVELYFDYPNITVGGPFKPCK